MSEHRRIRGELRAAARLLAGELRGLIGLLTAATSEPPYLPNTRPHPEWDRWEELLARWPDRELWSRVSTAYSTIDISLGACDYRKRHDEQLTDVERRFASQAITAARTAVERLDRGDGRRYAALTRAADDRNFAAIAASGPPPRDDGSS